MSNAKKPFFVGYLKPPGQLALFLIVCSLGLIIGFASASYLTGSAQDDPGDGRYRNDLKRHNLTGFFELVPDPVFHVTKGNSYFSPGDTVLLTRSGKRGLPKGQRRLEGKLVALRGILIQRGSLDMLQLRGKIKPVDDSSADEIPEIQVTDLGRWKLAGEICDGKCLAGAMRPGRGLAHKACANLCLAGDIPPVFVSSQKVADEEYFLITGPGKTPLPKNASRYIGQYIVLEGDLERRGNTTILMLDPETVRRL